jgi:hypothetical protein
MRRLSLVPAVLCVLIAPIAVAQDKQLPPPQLQACAAGDRSCEVDHASLMKSARLSCSECSPSSRPASESARPDGTRNPTLLCSIREMPLGPTVPGCVPPPVGVNSIPPL